MDIIAQNPDGNLLITLTLVGLFNLITVSALVHYSRKMGVSYLRLGVMALIAEIIHQLALVVLIHTGNEFMSLVAVAASVVFAALLFVGLCRLADAPSFLRLLPIAVLATLVMGAVFFLQTPDSEFLAVLLELPFLVLIVAGTALIIRHRTSPGRLMLASFVLMHVLLSLVMIPMASSADTLILISIFDSIAVMLAVFSLFIVAAETLMDNVLLQDDRLKQVEQENRRLELQFAQSQKHESLGVMAAGIAHDFNNMLTSVLGYTNRAIKKLPPDSDVRKDLYMVMSGGRQAVEMTSQMLHYAGKGALDFQPLAISQLVDNMSALINSLVPKRIHLEHKILKSLPLIRGDTVLLGQVLMSLVANAVDAIEGDGGTLVISTGISDVNHDMLGASFFADGHEPGIYVYLRVADSGIGMDVEEVQKIFDPFFSGGNQRQGLGLSSISGIVRQHRGFLQVESHPGKGSVFTVYLPVVAYRDPAQPGAGESHLLSKKGRVLLADDDSRIRTLIETLLEEGGYEVNSVVDGREALDELELAGKSYDAFVLDCTMPKLSGTELYREIRASGLDAPVILISGYHEKQIVNDISADKNASFLKKPFGIDELLEVINASVVSRARFTPHD